MSEPSTPQSDQTPAAGSVDCATATDPVPADVETDVQAVDTHLPESVPALPGPPPEPRVIAMINQKGGVGKTTTTVNIGAALAEMGMRVLLVDLDPQGHLTVHVGLDSTNLDRTIYDLLTDDDTTATEVIHQVGENLAVLPSEMNLAGIEAELAPKMITGRAQRILKEKCQSLIGAQGPESSPGDRMFDYVLIDCPPSLGLLTISALVLAREVVVPMQAHFLALQGLSKLLETVAIIRQSFNPDLIVSGVVLCMFEGHTLLAGEVLADLTAFLDANRQLDVPWRDAQILKPPIRRNIKLAESPSFGKTVFRYEPHCAGAEDYRALAKALAAQNVSV